MARVTDPEVRVIIPNTSIADLTPFIDAASLVVDRLAASDCGSGLSDPELKNIELWYSAHLASFTDIKLTRTSEKFENATNTYSRGSSTSMTGVMSTQFGQTANGLSDGCLAEMDLRKTSLFSIGGDCERI